jgi:hypothetical protein
VPSLGIVRGLIYFSLITYLTVVTVTTAVFSTCGMNIWVFMLAAFFSLPKQFITVYLGVALEDSEDGEPRTPRLKVGFSHRSHVSFLGQSGTKDRIINDVVIGVTVVVTVVAMWYIYHLMNQVKPDVVYERRKARYGLPISRFWVSR